jgi:FtsX-like permease family
MNRWQRLWRRRKLEESLQKELRFHLDLSTAEGIARGLDPQEARRRATVALGSLEQAKENCRDARGTRWLPVEFASMNTRIGKLTEGPRFDAMLLSLFAGIGVLLAALGLYGVVSFFVFQRLQEIGVRMALGARPVDIAGMVILNVARWTAAGAAVGLFGSWFAAHLLQSLLFQVPAHDPILLIAALLILFIMAGVRWFQPKECIYLVIQ